MSDDVICLVLLGGENVGVRGGHLRHFVGPLPRDARLQQLGHDEGIAAVLGPVVPHVCQNMHLHELVRKTFETFCEKGFFIILCVKAKAQRRRKKSTGKRMGLKMFTLISDKEMDIAL